MSPYPARNPAGRSLRHALGAFLAAATVLLSGAASGSDSISVVLDRATVLKMPEKVATVIVGNPLIADVSLQPGGIMVLTGKGFGATTVLMEKTIQVSGPRDDVVVVHRGVAQESYSCNPNCESRITLGDAQPHFQSALAQTMAKTGAAQGQSAK
jgi:Flp pilus assembly secretin CpaC